MKRIPWILSALILSISITGCQSTKPGVTTAETTGQQTDEASKITDTAPTTETTQTTDTAPTTETETEKEPLTHESRVYADLDSFLSKWWQNEVSQNGNHTPDQTETEHSMIVPIVKSPDYYLWRIEVTHYNFIYYYAPVGVEFQWYDYERGIQVQLSRTGITFSGVMQQLGLTPQNGAAHTTWDNMWLLDIEDNVDDNLLSVRFPPTASVPTLEDLYSYFDFEMRTYTASAETNATQ